MSEQSRIVELASIISKNTAMVAKYLECHGILSPSFNKNYVEPKDLPTEIMAAKQAIVEATEELSVLALGPTAFLTATNTTILPALHFIYRHDIATKFHIDEETNFAGLAHKIAMDVSDTERILRMAMTQRIFSELRPGVVAHTALSRAIATTPLLSSYLGLLTEEIWLSSSRVVDATAKWPGSNEPDETRYNLASGITDAYFEGLKKDPLRSRRFDEVMKYTHNGGAFERAGLVKYYDWQSISDGTVVELGGSQGTMCFDLARNFSNMKCISQDLPAVVEATSVPEDLQGRVQLMPHDFFTEQPIKNADAYLFRWIFHDWSDKYSIQILRNLIPALKDGARILIGELCLPELGKATSTVVERRMR
ncbi:S-adenosyl-L-methionine-dependent methyltransferase protein [Rutstroemia sp. NJR-2017a WRK4]|nr:S-adenosyl-L-methionine-dependent methyltransferase protein [Rutstroemia sp. NJR-2017a WRK4]PQE33144.1 S-adenosyl-L-methionine-dependent methyltransferase protein [Rutstroemia sp. NJR-2017a WRK4]